MKIARKLMRYIFCCLALSVLAPIVYADVDAGLAALEDRDFERAATEFQVAFEGGEADGAFYLGRMFELGLGTDVDPDRAVLLYAVAADQDSAKALNRLGMMYLNGEIVLQDYTRAAELLCAAADQGDANAQFNCGSLHAQGLGVDANQDEALKWYQAAAEQNQIAALNILGSLYLSGESEQIEQDLEAAASHFERSAAQGNPVGLYVLGTLFEEGVGVSQDLVSAHIYFNLAAVRRHPEAASARNRVTSAMSVEQVKDAQTRARAWSARPANEL